MLKRVIQETVQARLADFPAVAIVGPRQCGKTTLARGMNGRYFDLEQSGDRTSLDLQWNAITERSDLVVLDEAQSMPAIFPRLRGAIDADRKRSGRFLLLGSVSPALMREVSESLAGRLAVVEMSPFLREELPEPARQRAWLCGGYPDGGVLTPRAFPQWQSDYLTLLEGPAQLGIACEAADYKSVSGDVGGGAWADVECLSDREFTGLGLQDSEQLPGVPGGQFPHSSFAAISGEHQEEADTDSEGLLA